MKRIFSLFIVLMFGTMLYAQSPPAVGTPESDSLLLGSGLNFLLIPGVDDGDPGVDQEISFLVSSSDTSILEINEVIFEAGQTVAIIQVEEKGVVGTVSVQVEASDADGTASTSFDVFVGPYDNPGINFEIHDVVFWQKITPLTSSPAFSMIAGSGEAPYDQIDLEALKLSVYSDCKDSPPCTGTDFFTALFKGYLLPSESGAYTFYMQAGDQCNLGISIDEDFDRTRKIIYSPEEGRIGTSSGTKEWKSESIQLEAGKSYAIYGTHWNVHTLMGGIMWEGPGISKQFIPGANLSYVYDRIKPSVPGDFELLSKGINDLIVAWTAASDDRKLAGYRVYVNGLLYNRTVLKESACTIENLEPGKKYCLLVTSVDEAGNESAASELICTTSYESDLQPPFPPDSVEALLISDLFLKIAWSGAYDNETEIRGYRVYVDDSLYNDWGLVTEEELLLTGLNPETSYQIEIESVDVGANISSRSEGKSFRTIAFDPSDTRISDKKARLSIRLETIGKSEGLGINPNYVSGEFLDDPEQVRLIKELKVAAIRWGALTANPLNFEDFIGSGKAMTFARMMDFCNEIGAYTVITCGVDNSTDWRSDSETFTNFLEYLAGPPESTYGSIRVEEGYSESLLEKSRGLVFEFGNEVWGGISHHAQVGENYTGYGIWSRDMASLMRSSEYFDEEKIFLTYSGRRPVPSDSYGLHEDLLEGDTGQVDWLALSGYLGGNLTYAPEIDPGQSELEYYKNGIAEMSRNLNGLKATMELSKRICGSVKPSYFYEANMTRESYYGRLGQAIVQTDYYASAVETGGVIPTVFHLTNGQWKMVVPGQDHLRLPLFYTTKYYNRYCKGNVLETELDTRASVRNYSGAFEKLNPVGCFVYAREDSFSILLCSRDFENDIMVQLDLPDELKLLAPESAMKFIISGDGFSAREAQVDSSSIHMTDSLLVNVPKHSMVILSFKADGSGVKDVPLGYYNDGTSTGTGEYGIEENEAGTADGIRIYPNPFTDHTQFRITTSESDVLTLKVYDLSGTLHYTSGPYILKPGSSVIEWDGRGNENQILPSGTYICVFQRDGAGQHKRNFQKVIKN